MESTIKKAIIIGATSGIGRELARSFVKDNYHVGITGRRMQLINISVKDNLWKSKILLSM